MEPIWDVLTHVYFVEDGQWAGVRMLGRSVPIWGFPAYALYFGVMPGALLILLRRGLTKRRLMWGLVGFSVVNLALEIPILATGIYTYYGAQCLRVGEYRSTGC